MKNFECFISQLQTTNHSLDFFCDFDKVEAHIEPIKAKLCLLNSLVNSTNLRASVEAIWDMSPDAFQLLSLLIAVRDASDKHVLVEHRKCGLMSDYFQSVDGVMDFLHQTRLDEWLTEGKIQNLVDYAIGVEAGLDTAARKNRGTNFMVKQVQDIFDANNIKYRTELTTQETEMLSELLGNRYKRFDLIVEGQKDTYLMAINYYNTGAPRLGDIAKGYADIADVIEKVPGYQFAWITDGGGWKHVSQKFNEAYLLIQHVYNFSTVDEFIEQVKTESGSKTILR